MCKYIAARFAICFLVASCAKTEQQSFCIVQEEASLAKKSVSFGHPEVPSSRIDAFSGHRAAKGNGTVLLIDRRYLSSYGGLFTNEEAGHATGEIVSIEISNAEFGRMLHAPVYLGDREIALSTLVSGTFFFFPHVVARLDANKQSYLKREGQVLEGNIFLETKVDANSPLIRLNVPVSCNVYPTKRDDLSKCMGEAGASDWRQCQAVSIKMAKRTVHRKFCWDRSSDC